MRNDLENRLRSGREITETLPRNEIAFAFIKPDFLPDLPEIEKMLKDSGLEIILAEKAKLTGEAVDQMYGEKKDEAYYPVMKDYLTSHDSIVLMVAGKAGETQSVLSQLKKKPDGKPGVIREKFQKRPFISEEEKAKWDRGEHENQDEVTVLLTQSNVIHTADSPEEALESLRTILGGKFDEMKKKGNLPAELWEIFDEE